MGALHIMGKPLYLLIYLFYFFTYKLGKNLRCLIPGSETKSHITNPSLSLTSFAVS